MLEIKNLGDNMPSVEEQTASFDQLIGKYVSELTAIRVELTQLNAKMKEYVLPSEAGVIRDDLQPKIEAAETEAARLEGVIDNLKTARQKRAALLERRFGPAANDQKEHGKKAA